MTSKKDADEIKESRVRQAKGSVQEAIGKIIGDVAVEKRGSSESEAGARQAKAKRPAKGPANPPIDRDDDK
ncbi:hypothetical protein [Sphingomonas sp. M1A8_2b]